MRCGRCGGFRVYERFYGSDATVPAWTCQGSRCLNCGAVFFAAPDGPAGVRNDTLPNLEES